MLLTKQPYTLKLSLLVVIKLPPYKVEESGYGSFLLLIEIYFKNKEEPKKVKFEYDLYLQLVGNPPVTNVRVEVLTFTDPVEDFKKKLLKGGGMVVPMSGMNPPTSSRFVFYLVLS